jgi:hypothetical protein
MWVGSSASGVSRLIAVGAGTNVGSATGVAELPQDDSKTAKSGQLHQNRKPIFRNPGIDFHRVEVPPATTSAAI